MAAIDKPATLNQVWSEQGDIEMPPERKIREGWKVEIPPREWYNWIDNRQDQAIAHINQYGVAVWDSATEYQAGKSYAQDPSDGVVYVCLVTNTGMQPSTSAVQWKKAFADSDDPRILNAVPTSRQVISGDGLSGGGNLSANRTLSVDSTVVRTSRSITAGTGLSGGGTLAANRTLSVNYGTTAGTAAQGNDSRIVNAVPNTRQVVAGTGLSGGGTLAANRTLSVNYGTTAGTAVQGNDARLDAATTTNRGVSRYATSSETIAGGVSDASVTPAGLAALTATTGRKGLVELATNAETSGTSAVLAVTPSGLNATVLGKGQTWQDVTANRTNDTIYTNSTGRPIMVHICWGSQVRSAQVRSSASSEWVTVARGTSGSANLISLIVPDGSQYRLEGGAVTSLTVWSELR